MYSEFTEHGIIRHFFLWNQTNRLNKSLYTCRENPSNDNEFKISFVFTGESGGLRPQYRLLLLALHQKLNDRDKGILARLVLLTLMKNGMRDFTQTAWH